MTYPARLLIGEPSDRRAFVLQPGELVLRFDTTDADRIEATLRSTGLEAATPSAARGPRVSLSADMRLVRAVQQTSPPDELARRLLAAQLPATVLMVTPVYVLEGGGRETAMAPVPGRLLVQYRRGVEAEAKDQIARAIKMSRQDAASRHLAPFEMLARETERDDESAQSHGVPMIGEPGELFRLRDRLAARQEVQVAEIDWLLIYGLQLTPSDTHWSDQWSMARIGMPAAWDVQTGAAGSVIAVVDSGIDLAHPDLVLTPPATHFNAAEAESGPGPYDAAPDPADPNGAHGSLVAGIAAATVNNSAGVAGVAGGCPVMPIRVFPVATASRVAAGINWAAANGADVINLSLGFAASHAVIVTAIVNAWAAGLVLCAATGNYYEPTDPASAPVMFPARHVNCIAVGASDQDDRRKRAASADGEEWGSHWGAEIDVVAPGVRLWSTDLRGGAGWNDTGGGPMSWFGVSYASSGDASGDYFALMGGTSGATPHVAGLAALLRLQFPTLTNQQVRDVIERTCAKVSPAVYAYALDAAHPNGTWHSEVGYGRINARAALTFADLMIADHELDVGTVPSSTFGGGTWTPRPFWAYQPYVTTASNPAALPEDHQPAQPGQDNYVHARVRNNGPAAATNVLVTWHLMDYPGTELVYPADWNAANLIASTIIPSLAAGAETTVEALWPQSAVDVGAGYAHPCMVVAATTAADVNGQMGPYVYQYNNIAQHNISYAAMGGLDADRQFVLPFAVGHRTSSARRAQIHVDLRALEGATAYLDLAPDPDDLFVRRIREAARKAGAGSKRDSGCRLVAQQDTRFSLECCGMQTVVVLRAGSSMTLPESCAAGTVDERSVGLRGASFVSVGGRRLIALHGTHAAVDLPLEQGQIVPLAVIVVPPEHGEQGDRYRVDVTQLSEGQPTGGVSLDVRR